MKYSEIKDLTVEELRKRIKSMREDLFEAKMKQSLGQLADPVEIRRKRKDIARVLTALNIKLAQ
ncbi:MAG: 50S ribosomal protein L29 [Bdellovibrionales bacterium]|nr:50S ribosomal protein L29 [Bdellovibrionales bacterium]